MKWTVEQLYELLPAIYRIRDGEQGEPLMALLSVIAEQAGVIRDDIARLNENWFIETCDEWVVPYIGDLLGVRGLHTVPVGAGFSQRARVANMVSYRRRKGTATMLEQLTRDTTGWNARAVEFFELLEATQHYNHPRPHSLSTPDLRQTNQLELLNTPFDTIAHTVDVRDIATGRGRHNIPNVGLFTWRLQSYFVSRTSARSVGTPADGRYTFSPLGEDAPLFNRPQTEISITHLAEERNVPGLLRRRPLYDELEARRQALVDIGKASPVYFGPQPVFQVFVQGGAGDPFAEIPPEEILICNLTEPPVHVTGVWLRPATTKSYRRTNDGALQAPVITVAVDPVRGRLAFPTGVLPSAVNVSYAYGFSGDVGGGPYDRGESASAVLTRKVTWQAGVSKEVAPVTGEIFDTLGQAVAAWNAQPAGSVGVIAIMDSRTYQEDLTDGKRIKIPEGSQLFVVAADWPEVPEPGGGLRRIIGRFEPVGGRPHLRGNIEAVGTALPSSLTPGELALDGLLIEGAVNITASGSLGSLRITHCTLVPGKGGLGVTANNDHLKILITRSICGPIALTAAVQDLRVEESIVPGGAAAVRADGTAVEVERSTVLGSVTALRLEAGNSIFTGQLNVTRKQTGCLRFSYAPDTSTTPRRFRCQPDLATEGVTPAEKTAIIARLAPSFTSLRYGDPGYCQLSSDSAVELRAGAEDGSEMGVFNFLKQVQRIKNLQTGLDEYLRFGLEAGIINVT